MREHREPVPARSPARQREITIRLANGASRSRVIRQLLIEGALVGAIGGVLGLLLATWGWFRPACRCGRPTTCSVWTPVTTAGTFSCSRRTQRGKEIGVRMAFGADSRHLTWMTVAESLQLIGWGIVIGVPSAVGLMRLVKSLLFGLTPVEPQHDAPLVSVAPFLRL